MADKPDSVNVATVLVNKTLDETQEESQDVINVHVNANGSLIADTSMSHLFAVFGTLVEALDLVKSFFTAKYLCCAKAQFFNKIREQVADDTEVLRYARDLLFTITKRRKKIHQASSLVERKSGDGLQDKLLKDIFEIYSFGEGAKDSLPKSMLKDHVPVTNRITQDLLNSHQAELLSTVQNAKAEFISVVENISPVGRKSSCFIVNDEIMSGDNAIIEMWANHFEKLGMPGSHPMFNDNFRVTNEDEIKTILTECFETPTAIEGIFVYETVKEVCTNLKLGVSGGFDQVTYEHLKYGGPKLWSILSILYFRMFYLTEVPSL